MPAPEQQIYHRLIITAARRETEIWLGDDEGHFVQKAVGELRVDLMPGDYVVEFGLGAPTYPVPLPVPARFTQAQLEAGPTCPRPVPRIPDEGPDSAAGGT